MKRILMILALITSIAAVVGVGATIDARYAKSATVSQVSKRLDKKIDKDRMHWLQEVMYEMRKYWTEQFIVEKNYEPRTMSELLDYMTELDRVEYIGYSEEYEDLREKNKPKKKDD